MVGILDLFRPRKTDVVEAAPRQTAPARVAAAQRLGLESDVPMGGATRFNPGGDYPTDRATFMQELYGAYIGCPVLSAACDAVARTVTAGGLHLVPDEDSDPADVDTLPPNVARLQSLLDRINDKEDKRQLMRGVVTDAQVYGDGFTEVVWLLGEPVALYSLDSATMTVEADEHGAVTKYVQTVGTRIVEFEPEQIIHVTNDAPKGSLYGVGPAQKAMLPITIWLFAAALLKERMRKGDPPVFHADAPLTSSEDDTKRWYHQYLIRNLGIANVGNPIMSRGGFNLNELNLSKTADLLQILDWARDGILSECGVPPAKAGYIESGNLGGGTGTSQDKTFRVNTCGPIAEIVLEKFNYALCRAFNIDGWQIQFGEVDWRDDTTIEEIRDKRIRNGSWTLNDYLRDVGLPTVPYGDSHVIVDRQNIVDWADVGDYSTNLVAGLAAKANPPAPPPMMALHPGMAAAPAPPADDPKPDGEPPSKQQESARVRAHYLNLLTQLDEMEQTRG